MESFQLLAKTYALLAKCDLPLLEIAKGADVGLEWLKKFRARLIPTIGEGWAARRSAVTDASRGAPTAPASAGQQFVGLRRSAQARSVTRTAL